MNRRDCLKSLSALLLYNSLPRPIKAVTSPVGDSPYRVYDIHIHLVGISAANGCYVSPDFQKSLMYKLEKLFVDVEPGNSPEEQDRHYVKRVAELLESSTKHRYGILLALDGVYDTGGNLDMERTSIYVSNDYLFEVCKTSDKLVPGASINPTRKDALEELDRAAELGAVLIKWIPNSQNFDPSNKAFVPFYRRLVELNMPVLSHGGKEYAVPSLNQAYGNPQLLRVALEEGVRVIVAHCAASGRDDKGPYFFQFLDMLKEYPNLYGGLSALTILHKSPRVRYLLDHPDWFDRLYYGSDFPMQFFPATSPLYFVDRMTAEEAWEIQRINNVLERDVATWKRLGLPESCFEKGIDLVNR